MGKDTRVNQEIKAEKVRLVDSEGEQIGILTTEEALNKAQESSLDLVEVAPQANPPVVKILDWGKYQYRQKKQEQKARKKQKSSELKQIRFGLKIEEHDLNVKLRKIREFLEEGHKVKVTAYYKGREMAHKEIGYELLDDVLERLDDIAEVNSKPKMAGNQLSMVLHSK